MQWLNVLVIYMVCVHINAEVDTCRAKIDLQYACPDCCHGKPLNIFGNIQSILPCSELCSSNLECRSFQYNPATLECQTNARTLEIIKTSCSYLIRYGEIQKATCRPYWMFEPCNLGSNCPVTNSTCLNDRCECKNGHPYDYRSDSCPTECTRYGNTFHEVNYYFDNNGDPEIENNVNLTECFDMCAALSSIVCRFVEFGTNDGSCFMYKENALTAPDMVSVDSDHEYRKWDRNCA